MTDSKSTLDRRRLAIEEAEMSGRTKPLALTLLKLSVFLSVVADPEIEVNLNTAPSLITDMEFGTSSSSDPDGFMLVETSDKGSIMSTMSTTDATPWAPTGRWRLEATIFPTDVINGRQKESGEDNESNGAFSWYPISWSWVLILQLISAIVGIVGNFLVITVLFQRRNKSRSTDTLIGGLACADFLTSVFLIPIPWPAYLPSNWLGEAYCRLIITQSLLWTSITASTYLLMSISVERYIAVVYPLHFKHLVTRRRVSIFIVIVCFLSVLSGVFVFIVYGVDGETNQCAEQYTFAGSQAIIAYYWFCLRLAVPCLTMLVTQTLIARNLSQQSRNLKGLTNATGGRQAPTFHITARNRVLKLMLIVIIIYILCWTPNQIAYLGYNLGWVPESYLNSTLHRLLTVFGFYNSCANPVIYAARYPEFRTALKDMFTCTSPQDAPLFEKGGDMSKNSTVSEVECNEA